MKKNNILITAGGTIEPIDSVRSITNTSSGFLGKLIEEEFSKNKNNKIFHIASVNAMINKITDVESLRKAIKETCHKNKINFIVHSAAVSDYKVKEVLYNGKKIKEVNGKISSSFERLDIVLEKIPKVIKDLRKLAPQATIIGFKLLTDAKFSDFKKEAMDLLKKNDLDFVLANDSKNLSLLKHMGYLFNKRGEYTKLIGKKIIAEKLASLI